MEMNNKNVSPAFPLHTIKKVIMIEDRYHDPPDAESRVNQLLSKNWILLNLHTKEVSPKDYCLVYTLGHIDASADDTVKAIYQTPEEFYSRKRRT